MSEANEAEQVLTNIYNKEIKMTRPKPRTRSKKAQSRKGGPRKTDLVLSLKDREKQRKAARLRQEKYWASLAGPVTVRRIDEPI